MSAGGEQESKKFARLNNITHGVRLVVIGRGQLLLKFIRAPIGVPSAWKRKDSSTSGRSRSLHLNRSMSWIANIDNDNIVERSNVSRLPWRLSIRNGLSSEFKLYSCESHGNFLTHAAWQARILRVERRKTLIQNTGLSCILLIPI